MILWLASSAFATPLALTIEGLGTDVGLVQCALYDDVMQWLESPGPVATVRAAPRAGKAVCRFDGVSPGRYAVAFFHDLNLNGAMDYTALGLPKEPWGVSRDAPARLRRPRFEAAAFDHPGRPQIMRAR